MRTLPSALGRRVGQTSLSDDELEAMRRAAWLKQGVVMVRPDDLQTHGLAMALEAHAIARWGRRKGNPNE